MTFCRCICLGLSCNTPTAAFFLQDTLSVPSKCGSVVRVLEDLQLYCCASYSISSFGQIVRWRVYPFILTVVTHRLCTVCTCLGCWWYLILGMAVFFFLIYLSSLWSGLLRCLAASFFVVAGPLLAGAVVNLGTWACLVHYSKCWFFLKETLLLKPEHWSLQSWG